MTMAPAQGTFSVIVPTYNRASILIDALDSVRQQTWRPIELVIVDDGSSDNTRDVVERWMATNNEQGSFDIVYIRQQNSGVGAARNSGLEIATGKWIQFLDSDDRLHSDRLAILAEHFNRYGADFIQTGFEGTDPISGRVIETRYGRDQEPVFDQALRGVLWANTLRAAFTKELTDRIGPWRTDLVCFEDREYVERAIINAHMPVVIRDILASACRHQNARISDRLKTREGRICRILCEEQLGDAIKRVPTASQDAINQFASRLFGLALRTNAERWTDLGRRIIQITELFSFSLDMKGRCRKYAARSGVFGARLYLFAGDIKKWILRAFERSRNLIRAK